MRRRHLNKNRSARQFKRNASRTKMINIAAKPTRGGGRL